MNPLEKIKIGREYVSGPLADTELHAGGIFFCIPYEEYIVFYKSEKVVIKRRIIEEFRPMDQQDVDRINAFKLIGKYSLTDRNYIFCKFGKKSMIGLPLDENSNMIAFHNDFNNYESKGTVYKLKE